MKPKIKLVHFISSLEMGGAQAVLSALVDNLTEYEHQIIYVHDGPYKERFQMRGIFVHAIAGFGPRGFVQLMRLLHVLRPDCIHTSLWGANWLGRIAAWLYSIPCIMVLHNNSQINGSVRQTLDRFAPAPSVSIAVSHEVKKSFGFTDSYVIHNGVSFYKGPSQNKYALGLRDEHFVVGSVGRFHPDKQYDLLINSFALVAKKYDLARLVLFGSGAQEQYLRALTRELHLEEKTVFVVGQPAAPYYSLFDCFVLTSKNEGISMAMLEAMSNGVVPIMAHAQKDHPVILDTQNGLLVAHDAYAIATNMMQLIANPEARRTMGAAAAKTVCNNFSSQQMIDAYDRFFNTVANHNKF